MKYGSLEWANDLLEHAKSELDKIATADEKGKAAAEGLGLTQYYTNLVKSLEDEISKGNYKSEDSSDEGENINTDHLEWPKDPHDLSFYLSEEEEDELEKLFEEHPEISHSVMEEDDDSNPDEGDMNSNGAYYLNSDWVSPRAFFDHMKSLKPKSEDTDISGLAKSITQQDLGRTFDEEEK